MAIVAAASLCATASAQTNTRSGYFLDNYNYGYELNPAFGNEMNFVSIPVLGNINVGMRGNLHVTDIYHVVDGKTVLFTNPDVSSSFLKDMPDVAKLGADLKVNLLSGGWKAWGGYNTVTINATAHVDLGVPKEFMRLAKEGISNRTYDITDMRVMANAYTEIALNHSRDIKQVPGLRIGAAVKFLIGMANVDMNFKKAQLSLGQDAWTATTNAEILANVGKTKFKTKFDKDGREYVDGVDVNSVGPNGFGMAFDLGAAYKWRDFDFSLGLLDLGWISYFNTAKASTNGDQTINTDAYTFNADDKADNSFSKEWKNMRNDLEKLYQLDDCGNVGTRNAGLAATINVGVGYTLPYYRRLKFGVLNTTRILSGATWNETRISANVKPVDCFGASANFVVGTYGCAFGWMANYYGKGFSIYLAMDNTLGKLSKEGIPLNSNASFSLGMCVPFGSK